MVSEQEADIVLGPELLTYNTDSDFFVERRIFLKTPNFLTQDISIIMKTMVSSELITKYA